MLRGHCCVSEEDAPEPIARLSRDMLDASRLLSRQEIRYLVDGYYAIQEYRKASSNQVRSMEKVSEPVRLLNWLNEHAKQIEGQIKRALATWTDDRIVGLWAKSITGIGPVIAAGLMAHIDITKAPTVGHIWRYAGLDPTVVWEKGKKRPWNAELKTICWKAGQSFMKLHNHPKDIYGKLYAQRKAFEWERNIAGKNTEACARALLKDYRKDTIAYKWLSGQVTVEDATKFVHDKKEVTYAKGGQQMLPPGQIDQRAQRWAVKLFLAHFHHVCYEVEYNTAPPKPYVIEHLGHADIIGPPNWPLEGF